MTLVEILILGLLLLILAVGLANFFKPAKTTPLNRKIDSLGQSLSQGFTLQRQDLASQRQELTTNLTNQQEVSYRGLSNLTEQINEKFDHQFKSLQSSNEKKLNQIQAIVDEKLQETLNQRISQSFEQVTQLLAKVDKDMGEMRNLASDVDSLQKVMTGVKTRGMIGEIQLQNILEQILAPNQYRIQEKIKDNTQVDFAVVMPGRDGGNDFLLPIDSKFPMEDYQRLTEALETNDGPGIEESRKKLFAAIKAQAKSISEKYILPPKTTDFALMFLPTEGLFMEVVNHPALYEQLSQDYKVNVTGPTTMTAVLNSLQMGFKTLQIEQKSSEVYEMLREVKTEFGNYEKALLKVQKDLKTSTDDIDKLVTTRTRAMNRKLSGIEVLEVGEEE